MGAVGRTRLAFRLLAASALAGALMSAPASASPATCQAWTEPPAVGTGANYLNGVTLAAGCAAWAVGREISGEDNESLIDYWDGTAWSAQPGPDPSATDNVLQGTAAVSRSDAWAVGYYINTTQGAELPLIVRWNGTAWTQVASSITTATSQLYAVSARSAASAWAVGETYNRPAGAYQALILHWNGTAWAEQPSGAPSSGTSYLKGVTAISPSDAWAVGYSMVSGLRQALILHWNGSVWAKVPNPNPSPTSTVLSAVTATSSTNAWAVGEYVTSQTDYTLIEHWNGTAWTQVPSPTPGGPVLSLSGVAASSASDAWAVGDYGTGTAPATHTLVEHWNGTAWTQVPSPDPGGTGNTNSLTAVAALDSNAGAVGSYFDSTGVQPLAVRL
jgi:hypothetical protein